MVLKYWGACGDLHFCQCFRGFLTIEARARKAALLRIGIRLRVSLAVSLDSPARRSRAGRRPICGETPCEFRLDPSKMRRAFAECRPPEGRQNALATTRAAF